MELVGDFSIFSDNADEVDGNDSIKYNRYDGVSPPPVLFRADDDDGHAVRARISQFSSVGSRTELRCTVKHLDEALQPFTRLSSVRSSFSTAGFGLNR